MPYTIVVNTPGYMPDPDSQSWLDLDTAWTEALQAWTEAITFEVGEREDLEVNRTLSHKYAIAEISDPEKIHDLGTVVELSWYEPSVEELETWLRNLDAERPLTEDERRAWLNRHGNLDVPASRYGRKTQDCAEIALIVDEIVSNQTGVGHSLDSLEHVMGLVVNDHEDPAYTIYHSGDEQARALGQVTHQLFLSDSVTIFGYEIDLIEYVDEFAVTEELESLSTDEVGTALHALLKETWDWIHTGSKRYEALLNAGSIRQADAMHADDAERITEFAVVLHEAIYGEDT